MSPNPPPPVIGNANTETARLALVAHVADCATCCCRHTDETGHRDPGDLCRVAIGLQQRLTAELEAAR